MVGKMTPLRRPWSLVAATPLLTASLVLLLLGCGGPKSPDASEKLKVAYLGLTCEAPIFVAYENGFFKDEGVDVELVRTDWEGLQHGLGTGRFDANHTLIMYLLKPIENQLDVKITGGIHTGCLRVQSGINSNIHGIEDLKGKRIGFPSPTGSPPHLFASRVLANHKLDPRRDVVWRDFQADVLGKALENGQIDAVATSDPIGTILLGKGLVRTIADQATDAPYKDEYCCAAVVSGQLAARDPAAAAKLTRALLKAAKWVETNPVAAANLSVEKNYLASLAEINAQAISNLRYIPGVEQCRKSVQQAAREMKAAGLLAAETDPEELARKAWLDLDGVSDDWIKGLKFEKVANGGRPARLTPEAVAALFDDGKVCCCCCCLGE